MLRNYLKVAWRNLSRNKTFSIINVAGLAIGLACFLLIALYVLDELSYDRYNEKADRIFRIHTNVLFGGTESKLAATSDMMGAIFKRDYPEVEQYTRIYSYSGAKFFKKGNELVSEGRLAFVDSTFFDVFTFPALHGNTRTALNDPNTIVVTASAARRYFGKEDVVGKVLEVDENGGTPYKITAVIKDMPRNSHFNFEFMLSMDNLNYNWGDLLSHNFFTYVLLREGVSPKQMDRRFDDYLLRYVMPAAKQIMNVQSLEEFRKAGNNLEYFLFPLTDIHLKSDRSFDLSPNGNMQYVYIFSIVALIILVIACINFMNLTTARSAKRAREVGIRKVLGTQKGNLIVQFLAESTLMVVLALGIAIIICYLVIGLFNDLAAKNITINDIFSYPLLPVLVALPLVVGLVAGSYPAFFLSAFRPIEVLKSNARSRGRTGGLRSVLVVVQFTTSIILIIGTIVIYRQLNYIQTKNLGFNKDQVMIVYNTGRLNNNVESFRNELLALPGVRSISMSAYLPVESSRSENTFSTETVMNNTNGFSMQQWLVDHEYVPTMGMEMIGGRNFDKSFGGDSSAIIINEAAARLTGFADPLGKKLYRVNTGAPPDVFTIVGIVKNFHFSSLREQIGPVSFVLGNSSWMMSARIDPGKVKDVISVAENKWKARSTGVPFAYSFMDEAFDNMYRAEQRIGKIALTFSVLAIFVACLGLFGLSAFVAEQRTKEIGIRKVLGARIDSLVSLLSADFLRLVTISIVVASPIAWYFMNKWLQDFVFRAELSWWIFPLAGIVAIVIALITISFQSIRAALMNPVKSLRTE